MGFKEGVCAATVCLGHAVVVASAWQVHVAVDRARPEHHERVVPLVAYFYDASRASTQTGLQAIAAGEVWETSIELEPPPDITAVVTDSVDSSREARSPYDQQELVRLQGLYRGQLFARVRRVLQEFDPLEESAETPCVLNVIQRQDGSVVDVLNDLCEYTPRSLLLLRAAVFESSPLPRPPPGLAMGTYLSLDMAEYLSPATHSGAAAPPP
jgi:hypothetical protein